MNIHVDIRGFLKIHAWICYVFSDQGCFHLVITYSILGQPRRSKRTHVTAITGLYCTLLRRFASFAMLSWRGIILGTFIFCPCGENSFLCLFSKGLELSSLLPNTAPRARHSVHSRNKKNELFRKHASRKRCYV